jgi:methionine-rich copper-binding protein CopC
MAIPVVIVDSGGLAVTEAENGYGVPMTEADNGFGLAVTFVDEGAGGLAVVGISNGARIQLSALTVAENAAVGAAVGTLTVSNGSGTYTFSLTDSAGGKFAVDGTALEVGGALNYEAATSHTITVEADNGVDTPISRSFTINVTNVVEAPGEVEPTWDGTETDSTPGWSFVLPFGAGDYTDAVAGDLLVGESSPGVLYTSYTLLQADIDAHAVTGVASADPLADGTYAGFRWRLERGAEVGEWAAATNGPVVVDATGPTIQSLSPADGATNASGGANLTVTFNENVAFGTGNITIFAAADDSTVEAFNVATEVGTGAGQVSISGAVLTINPTSALSEGTSYYVQIAATAIDDAYGNSFAGILDETTWNFTVQDTTAPTISSLSPVDGAASVALTANFVVTFDEDIQAGAAASVRLYETVGDVLVEEFDETDFGGALVISGAALTINWSSDLTAATDYYIQIDAGSVEDLAGNAFGGIADETTWNVTATSGGVDRWLAPNGDAWLHPNGTDNWVTPT